MKNSKKSIACLLTAVFILCTFRINTFAVIASSIANTTNQSEAPWIASDLEDYPPGALVTLTGGGWSGDSEVEIVIEGSKGKEEAWRLERVAAVASEGRIELKFNLPNWYIPQYRVTAKGVTTGRIAQTSFTDSAGSYTLKFYAYDPDYYNFVLPGNTPQIENGWAVDPLPGANGSNNKKLLTSLEPQKLALGQIVPFEVEITVNGSTQPEGGKIDFTCFWSSVTSSGKNFGYDPGYMIYEAFVDRYSGDTRYKDSGNMAKVDSFSEAQVLQGNKVVGFDGTISVSGLDDGDTIIVEIWVVLMSEYPIGENVNSNVQTNMVSAKTNVGSVINIGNQTVPLSKIGGFEAVKADVSISKTDTPDPINLGDTLNYTIEVKNNSATTVANGIVVKDILDPNVSFVSADNMGKFEEGVITWPAFALEPGSSKTLQVKVAIKPNAPTENYGGILPHEGSPAPIDPITADILNKVEFAMITQDDNPGNNVYYQPTNVLPRLAVTAVKRWLGGPASDHQPVALTLYRQVEGGSKEVVVGVTPKITPETGTAAQFTYVWEGLPAYDSNVKPYIYTVDELEVPEGYLKTMNGNTITNTYKPSLTILKVFKATPLQGAEFKLYAGNANGPTGDALQSITTGAEGIGTFGNLASGTYWVVETKAPSGYKLAGPIGPFLVQNGTITGPPGFVPVLDETTGNYLLTVPNEPERELPATGGFGTLFFSIIGMGIMALAVLYGKRINRIKGGN